MINLLKKKNTLPGKTCCDHKHERLVQHDAIYQGEGLYNVPVSVNHKKIRLLICKNCKCLFFG